MDAIKAFDRAQEAFELARKEPVQQKTMVYIIPSKVKQGVVQLEVRFPWRGTISNIYATCGKQGKTDTILDIEKCAETSMDTGSPEWISILDSKVMLDANAKTTKASDVPYMMNDSSVDENDHFRVNVLTVGESIEDIILELVVDI